MGVLPRLFKLWPWIDLDLFNIKVKFGYIGFCMGESVLFFFGNYCSLKHSAKWVNEVERGSEVNVILWTWPKVIQISKLNVWLWPVYSGERFRASWPSCWNLAYLLRTYWRCACGFLMELELILTELQSFELTHFRQLFALKGMEFV